jgi:hypothetical protein
MADSTKKILLVEDKRTTENRLWTLSLMCDKQGYNTKLLADVITKCPPSGSQKLLTDPLEGNHERQDGR